jgi:hypothetical protein
MSHQEDIREDEQFFSHQEKGTIVSLATTILSFAIYCIVVFQKYQDTNFDSANSNSIEEFKFWASVILILIPVLVVSQIIAQIVFVIINAIVMREEAPEIIDEFDKLIDLKSTRNFYHTFMVGFLLSMIAIVLDEPPATMLIIMFAAILVSGVILDLSKLYYYRRGF